MINAILVLLGFQLGGEILVRFFALPVPGPVIAACALTSLFLLRGTGGSQVPVVSKVLLANLSLLFVPAAVGVIEYGALFSRYGLQLVATVAISTVLALAATALTFRWVAGR